jgi:quercetin dioxygenase-like cupin family protein
MLSVSRLLLLLVASYSCCFAQDAAIVSADYYSELLRNDHIRVLRLCMPAGEQDMMHSHPTSLIYYFNDAEVEVASSSGTTKRATLKANSIFFQPPTTHRVRNIGSTEIHAISIELRSPTLAEDNLKLMPHEVEPDSNSLWLDNEEVRVVYTETEPGVSSALHEHMPMVVIAITPANLRIEMEDGRIREILVPQGAAVFSPAVKHRVTNIGESTVRLLHVEIK